MRGSIDRIEGYIAVCEMNGQEMLELPIKIFDRIPKDGDCFEYANGCAWILEEETQRKKQDVQDLFSRLKKRK